MTVGLTGGIGSGKSTVAKVLESMGFAVFYSDTVAKDLMLSDTKLQLEITQHFGQGAFINGNLNRSFLAERIFSNPEDKHALNQLIHPKVRERFSLFAQQSKSKLVFNEAAILFETGAYTSFDRTILVVAPQETRIKRVLKRDNASRAEIENRMKNQWSDDQKIPLANYVIKNGDEDPVLEQIEQIVDNLLNHSTSS